MKMNKLLFLFQLKILAHYISSNNLDLVKELISYEGRLWNYRFSSNAKLVQESLNIYKQIIVVKSIPIAQELYNNLLVESEMSFATLLKHSSSNNHHLQDTTITTDEDGEFENEDELCRGIKMLNFIRNAETSFLFNLCVFAELGNASKSNLISVCLLFQSTQT